MSFNIITIALILMESIKEKGRDQDIHIQGHNNCVR